VRIELHIFNGFVTCGSCGQRWQNFHYDPEVGFYCPICSQQIIKADGTVISLIPFRDTPPKGLARLRE
jgi:predicted RNA-binding Zn-ribbon protein involved in translation (DUF1610 family)